MWQIKAFGVIAISGMYLGLGCQIVAGLDKDVIYDPTTSATAGVASGAGGSGGNGGSSSTGGMGGSPECNTLNDCKSGECRTPTGCDKGVCVWSYTVDGTLSSSQLYGDCQDRVCDGNGGIKFLDTSGDDTQWYKWNNPCYLDACNAPLMPMPNDGAMCTTPWSKAGKCQSLKCVECVSPADCPSGVCSPEGRCIAMTCTDMMLTAGETDIDCGGPDCVPCGPGLACVADSDCTGKCENLVCAAPSCSDGLRNQDETDTDCGGLCAMEATPKKCATIKKCLFPADCVSGSCQNGECKDASCLDQIQNQNEAGIDCGGTCPLPCP
jgi:hypothetical protein